MKQQQHITRIEIRSHLKRQQHMTCCYLQLMHLFLGAQLYGGIMNAGVVQHEIDGSIGLDLFCSHPAATFLSSRCFLWTRHMGAQNSA